MFALEGFIEKGTQPELTLNQLADNIQDWQIASQPVLKMQTMPFPRDNPRTYITLTWDEKWCVSIHLIKADQDFEQEIAEMARAVAKVDLQKAQAIQHADQILRVMMGNDLSDDYISHLGILLTERLAEFTGCIFVEPNQKRLF
ncbi:hypothetical protein [Listeria costaricensis]|uniref:hypothetical protein n=1 Tax=Listeria costaricensis TaxID=2026604 RepID=UPI000C085B90|nr:hypothetical protein [Listeria costaricensis]